MYEDLLARSHANLIVSKRKFRGYQERTPSASLISIPKTNLLAPLIMLFCITMRYFLQGQSIFLRIIPAPAHLFYDLVLSARHMISYIFSLPFFCIFSSLKSKAPTNQNLTSTFILYQTIFLSLLLPSSLNFWK